MQPQNTFRSEERWYPSHMKELIFEDRYISVKIILSVLIEVLPFLYKWAFPYSKPSHDQH